MEINFGKSNEAVPTGEHTTTAEAPRPSTALGFVDRLPGLNEIILPRINLVHFTGKLKDSFQPGSIVHNQSTVLYRPPIINHQSQTIEKPGSAPLVLTALDFRPTQFIEKVAGGKRGLLCNTEEEVTRAGGTLDYKEFKLKEKDGMKRFDYLATALVAIERPEIAADDDTVFVYEVDGKKYALALWGMKGSAYTRAAKKVFFTDRRMGPLRNGYPCHSYNVTTRPEPTSDGSSTYIAPVVLPNKKNSPEFLAWVQSVLQTPKVEVPESEGDE